MPFRLTNALNIVQRFVNEIFADLLDIYILVYLDDILIFSNNMADYKKHVKEVLQRLQEHGLFVNGDKCCFHSLTQKATLWNFDDNCCLAFQTLKDAFITALVLTHWKPGHSFIVETDASNYALAGILSI